MKQQGQAGLWLGLGTTAQLNDQRSVGSDFKSKPNKAERLNVPSGAVAVSQDLLKFNKVQ